MTSPARAHRMVRRVFAMYYGMVACADYQMSRVCHEVESRGLLDNTGTILVLDHRDYAGEPRALRVDGLVETVDLFATMLGAAGVELPGECQSQDLMAWVRAQKAPRPASASLSGSASSMRSRTVLPTFCVDM